MTFSSRLLPWVLWLMVVFGALNCYGPSLWSYQPPDHKGPMTQAEIVKTMTPLQFLGVLLRNDDDTGRYFSYANAILGRPYGAYYVRPMKDWTHAEDEDAASRPSAIVTPKRPLLPWRDFSVEYPPGMLICALIPAFFTADKNVYHLLFNIEMELLLTLTVWLSMRTARRVAPELERRTLLLSVGFIVGLGVIAVRRYDGAVALTIAAALYGLSARKSVGSGLALAAGTIIKGVPILLAPIGLGWFAARGAWSELRRSLAGATALLLAAVGLYCLIAGPHALDSFAYHGGRPLQIESSYSALLIAARLFDPDIVTRVYSFGSDNIVSVWEPTLRAIASIAPIVAVLGVYLWSWRELRRALDDKAQMRLLFAAVSAALVAFVTLGKIFSPQYFIWLLPSGVLASVCGSAQSRRLLIAACALTQLEYPFAYSVLAADLDPRLGLLVLLRDGLLLWWTALLMIEASAPRAASAAVPVAA